ncbi:unnamed protein product, partial [Mesorhabditis spiculigera]
MQYKNALLAYQFLSAMFETYVHLATPEIFIPVLAARVHGNLFAPLDPQPLFQFGAFLLLGMVVATAVCFLYRHRQLLEHGHPLRQPVLRIGIFIGTNYVIWCWLLAYVIQLTRTEKGGYSILLSEILTKFPDYEFLKTVPGIWAADANGPFPLLPVSLQTMFCLTIVAIILEVIPLAFLLITHSFYLLNGHVKMSENRRLMHKKLLTALVWQAVVPFLTLAGPWGVGAVVVYNNIEISQEVANLLFYFDGCHGLMSLKPRTLVLIFGLHHLFYDGFFVHTLSLGNAELGNGLGIRERILEQYPEYSFVRDHPDFFAGDASAIYPLTGLTLQMNACALAALFTLENVGFFIVIHAFRMLDGRVAWSRQTLRLQAKLMRAIILQMTIPYVTLLFPWGLFVYALVTKVIVSPASWSAYSGLSIALAINRCCDFKGCQEKIFGGRKIYLWTGIPVLYGIGLYLFLVPMIYNVTNGGYFFGPDPMRARTPIIFPINNVFVSSFILVLNVYMLRAMFTANYNKMNASQKVIILQCFVISMSVVLTGWLYVAMQFFVMPEFTILMANIFWQFSNGSMALSYLFINKSMRQEVVKILLCERNYRNLGWSTTEGRTRNSHDPATTNFNPETQIVASPQLTIRRSMISVF